MAIADPDSPGVISGSRANRALLKGFQLTADLLARTLGPNTGTVLNGGWDGRPEPLSDAATIARRLIELPERCENAGAMLLRSMVWRVWEQYGDGCAIAAVIARDLALGGSRVLAAGGDFSRVRRGIERGLALAVRALEVQAQPVRRDVQIAQLAACCTADREMAVLLGELFDLLGQEAAVLVEDYPRPGLDREYVVGARWPTRPAARIFSESTTVRLERPLVAVIDEPAEDEKQVVGLLEAASEAKRPLLMVCRGLSGRALELVGANLYRQTVRLAAVAPDADGAASIDDLDDIALMTGAEVLGNERCVTPAGGSLKSLGSAAQATITASALTIAGGGGPATSLRSAATHIRRRLDDGANLEAGELQQLRRRLGRLTGATGILRVGGVTDWERERRQFVARKAVKVLELGLLSGAVPGGGAAYLLCQPALQAEISRVEGEEAIGLRLMSSALAAPLRQIARNTGREPGPVLDEIRRRGPGYGFDAGTGAVRDLGEAGILDSLTVVRGALEAAVSCTLSLLGAEVVVLIAPGQREVRTRP